VGGDSDVRVGWGVSWLVASTWAVSLSDSGVGESPSAWAVSDGQGGGLSDGVGLVVLHNGSSIGAVGGVLGDDLSGGKHGLVAVAVSRDGSNGESSSENGRGTHFGFFGFFEVGGLIKDWRILRKRSMNE